MLLLCFPVGILESAEMELTLNTESLASVSVFSLSVVLVVLVIVVVCSVGCITCTCHVEQFSGDIQCC